jgi:hypothetical protein
MNVDANAFLLNSDIVYLNPVSPQEFSEIYRAITADDKMGVSLSAQTAIVYGRLSPQGEVAGYLELADRFLGDITFGSRRIIRGYVFAAGYDPKPVNQFKNLAVYFNIHDMRFREAADGTLARSGVSLDTTLVPLSATAGSDGGHLPDLDRVRKGDVNTSQT